MSATLPSVVIAGFGCVSPLGIGREETVLSLRASRDSISPVRLFSVEASQCKTAGQVDESLTDRVTQISPKIKRWTRSAQMVVIAMDEALRTHPGFRPDCVVIGTTSGGMSRGEDFLRAMITKSGEIPAARRIRDYVPHQPILQAMRLFGFDAPVRIISNACASGTNALGVARQLIHTGQARRVLAGGYDALPELVFAGFDCLKAATTEKTRPFDAGRTGLCLGEGAAMFCLEAEDHTHGIRLAGYGSAFDAHHLTQPHPSGRGPRLAMERALIDAGLTGADIDYVNAHGTGTPLNDSSEGRAILDVCPQAPVSSTKSMMGHSLGAAGAIEAAFCTIALEEGFLPANINFRSGEPDLPLDIIANEIRNVEPKTVISNSFGFGGSNASLILRTP